MSGVVGPRVEPPAAVHRDAAVDVAFSGVMGDVAAGESAGGTLTLQGGNIPEGPISYTITFE